MNPAKHPLDDWRRLEKEYISAGLSRYRAYINIAKSYGLSRTTIYNYLIPQALEKDRVRARKYSQTPQGKKRRKEYYSRFEVKRHRQEYEKAYRQRPRVKIHLRSYNTKYKSVNRRLHFYLLDLFTESDRVSIGQVIDEIYEVTQIQMKRKTIRKALKRYSQFVEVERGIYKLASE